MNKSLKHISILTAALSILTACGAASSDSSSTAATTTTSTAILKVADTAGGKTNFIGTWISTCSTRNNTTAGTKNDINTVTIVGENKATSSAKVYTSADGSCSGTATEEGSLSGTFTLGADTTSGGWIDNASALLSSPPLANDGKTQLPATPTVTATTSTITASAGTLASVNPVGTVTKGAVLIDVSNASSLAYYSFNNDATNGLVANASNKRSKQ